MYASWTKGRFPSRGPSLARKFSLVNLSSRRGVRFRPFQMGLYKTMNHRNQESERNLFTESFTETKICSISSSSTNINSWYLYSTCSCSKSSHLTHARRFRGILDNHLSVGIGGYDVAGSLTLIGNESKTDKGHRPSPKDESWQLSHRHSSEVFLPWLVEYLENARNLSF